MINKPVQTRMRSHSDWSDLHEALDSAMFNIREAMESMKGYPELVDKFSELSDLHDELYAMYEECETNINAEYADMVREITRDYYRSVI